MGNTRKRTIAEELHKKWQELTRRGDAEKLTKLLGVSKPTIDNALAYGGVHKQEIVDGITKFFADRIMAEKEAAQSLTEMAKSNGLNK